MNQIRIIGGQWKRRQIRFENIEGLRPTPDRVRETLFNWLMYDVGGARVLDLCAGSGALGFEALSRGAASCYFVEPDRKQVTALKAAINTLDATARAHVLATTAQKALERLEGPFDLLFLDPPYSLNLWQSLATPCDALLSPTAWIYVEADRPFDQLGLPTHWHLHRQTQAGSVYAGLFQRQSTHTAVSEPAPLSL